MAEVKFMLLQCVKCHVMRYIWDSQYDGSTGSWMTKISAFHFWLWGEIFSWLHNLNYPVSCPTDVPGSFSSGKTSGV
jgi:hypothetical protein